MASETSIEATFVWERSAPGERAFVHAAVHRGGVMFGHEKPGFGGTINLEPMTFDEVLEKGPPMIDRATARDLIEFVRRFPRQAADDPNAWDQHGVSLLTRAAQRGDLREVERLLLAGADARAVDFPGGTPLHGASRALALDVVDRLLRSNADPDANASTIGSAVTPLSSALQASGDDEARAAVIERLVDGGAHATIALLWRAASGGNLRVFRAFLRSGVDPNQRVPGGEDLAIVAAVRDREMLVDLLRAGADPCARDGRGVCAIEAAIDRGVEESVATLLEVGVLDRARAHEWIDRAQTLGRTAIAARLAQWARADSP